MCPVSRPPAGRRAARPPYPSPRPSFTPLLAPLSDDARRLLDKLSQALAVVRPLKAAHRKALPRDVADLSRLLTVDRADLRRPYWGTPGLASAYMHYFLPWNIVRLARLLATLPLPDPRLWLRRGLRPWLLDAGSGPLTLPLALWLARPEWRELPLGVLALDAAAQPLDLGRRLLRVWADLSGQPVAWSVETARGPLEHLPRHAARLLRDRRDDNAASIWLVGAANVLNELYGKGAEHEAAATVENEDAREDGEDGGAPGGRLAGVLDALAPLLWEGPEGDDAPAPATLFVEPGTRLGGKTVMRLRALALEGGLSALSPCPHDETCPLLADRRRGWCHFTFDSEGAPAWLRALSEQAGLAKSSLSLAPLLLLPGDRAGERPDAGARVLSAPFRVPGLRGEARYACGASGLLLLEQAEDLPSGAFLTCRAPDDAAVDGRSGARIVRAPAPRSARPKVPEGARRPREDGPGRDGTRGDARRAPGEDRRGHAAPDRTRSAPSGSHAAGKRTSSFQKGH